MIVVVSVAGVIGIAIGWFLSYGADDYDIALDRTMKDKLRELPPLYDRAEKSIDIATDFDSKFFDAVEVKTAIGDAVARGVTVRLITECDPLEWYNNQSGIQIKRVGRLSRHIMVIDGKHFRLERPHTRSAFGDKKYDGVLIFKDFPVLASRYSNEFGELWTKSSC